tara:strand:- start:81851 stop:82711 length:861 start_codon:yes stop_codon:yes gene_type:complete
MLVIAGYIVVFVSVIGGFMIAGGNPMLLLHVSEFVVIGGMALGVLLVASPMSVINHMINDIKSSMLESAVTKEEFMDLLKLLYEMFMVGRRNGLIGLDDHLNDPQNSSIFSKYPSFIKDPNRVTFLCNALRPIIDGKIKPEQLGGILDDEIYTQEVQANESISIISLIGDSLPGIGIVAAVLGIINTMAAISEGPEAVGAKVAAALTGTFLGILFAYGFINPLAKKIQLNNKMKFMYYNVLAGAITSFAQGLAPLMAIEIARRSLDKCVQPEADELENILKEIKTK